MKNIEINKISLSSYDDKRVQSIDSIETYPHEIFKDIIWKKEKIKQLNKIIISVKRDRS